MSAIGSGGLVGMANVQRQQAAVAEAALAKKDVPPEMSLDDILVDPENARRPEDEETPEEQESQAELDADVKERGVKSPISLRKHPTTPEKWIINFGHRRFKAARRAGLKTIPYFVDEEFDSYDQVNETELHCRLTPWAMAQFIMKRIKKGDSKGEVARRLRKKSQNVVTEYLALMDPPACVVSAYVAGVKSPRTLYDLRKARDEFPEQFEAWCARGVEITRDTIKALLDTLRSSRAEQDIHLPDLLEAEPHLALVSPHEFCHDEKTHAAADDVSEDAATIAAETGQAFRDAKERAAASAAALQATTATVQEVRHQEKLGTALEPVAGSAQAFRHHEKEPAAVSRDTVASLLVKAKDSDRGIAVQYKGKAATLEFDTVVRIVVDGHDEPLEVKVSELVFKRR